MLRFNPFTMQPARPASRGLGLRLRTSTSFAPVAGGSQPWTPLLLPGVRAWIRPKNASALTTSSGRVVSISNPADGPDLTAPTTGPEPATVDGHDTLAFDAADEAWMSFETQQLGNTRLTPGDGDRWYVGVVANFEPHETGTDLGNGSLLANRANNTNDARFQLYYYDSLGGDITPTVVTGGNQNHTGWAYADSEWHFVEAVWDGGLAMCYGDGGADIYAGFSNRLDEADYATDDILVGARSGGTKFYATGNIGDIIIADRQPDVRDVWRMQGFVMHSYGLAARLPGWHPYKEAPPVEGDDPKASLVTPGELLLLGSSTISLWPDTSATYPGWADPYGLTNEGYGGTTFDNLRGQVSWSAKTEGLNVVYCGENDASNGMTPEDIAEDFAGLRTDAEAAGNTAPWLYIGIKPSPSRSDKTQDFSETDAKIMRLPDGKRPELYLGVYDIVVAPDGSFRSEMFADDNLHLSASGYAELEARLRNLLDAHGFSFS